jgi:hypothetical protein
MAAGLKNIPFQEPERLPGLNPINTVSTLLYGIQTNPEL